MNRLQTELQRLYHSPEAGRARALVLELARPASWASLAPVWRGVQADLELPAPAIAVSGSDGYQLWFSLAEPAPADQAIALLEALRKRYLGDIAQDRIGLNARGVVAPPIERTPGRWSAFVAPDLPALFEDEPWLDLPPGADAQADLLSRLASIKPGALKRAWELLAPGEAPQPAPAGDGVDPRGFLLGIMNDRTIDLHLRIDAAKALLPYFEGARPL